MKVLSRINPLETYHRVSCRRKACEDAVISGLSITPSDIERLARQGVPVSVPNASSFFSVDSGLEVPPELREDAYRDWETDRKSTRLNSSHITRSRMPSSA